MKDKREEKTKDEKKSLHEICRFKVVAFSSLFKANTCFFKYVFSIFTSLFSLSLSFSI